MQPLLFASHGLNHNPESSQLHHKCALHAAVHFMNSISIGTFNSFQIIVFFGVLLQAEVTQRLSYGRETSEGNAKMHSHEDLAKKLQVIWDCIIAAISLLPFWFCIFLTLTWSLGVVGFSSYFKVLCKLPCATLLQLHGWFPKFPLAQGRGDFCVSKQWLLLRKK